MRIRTGFLAIVAIMLCNAALAQTATLRAERELFASINVERKALGLPALRWDESLATAARRHAEIMAKHKSSQHGFEGEPSLSLRAKQAGARFTWLSENVHQGPSPQLIHTQFMKSPSHRSNILDKDMNSIGVGVVDANGELFAVEDFAQAR